MMLSAGNGFIMQSKKYSRDNAGQSLKKYILLKQGELAYNHGASKAKQFGCCYELTEPEARIPYVYHCFKINNQEYTPFIAMALNNAKMDKQLKRLVSSSVRMDGLLNISFEDYMSVTIHLPSSSEQKHIADFLQKIDERIVAQEKLIASLKKYKRGLLQQIFSRKLKMSVGGESWEYILLGEIGCFFGGLTGKSKENFDHGDSKFITYMNVYKNTFADETMVTAVDVLPNERQNAVRYGDILFTQSSETVEEVGLTSVWVHDTTPYLNSFCMALRPHSLEKFNPYYLGYVLRSPKIRKAIMKEGQGISRINLAASRIENIPIPIPLVTVQIKIVDYLKKWDGMISANEKTLTGLISLKKAFLQSLFI